MSIGRAQSPELHRAKDASALSTSRARAEICVLRAALAACGRRAGCCFSDFLMRTATAEEIAALELLAVELERTSVLRLAVALERDRELRTVELELASAVSLWSCDGGGVATASVASRDSDRPVVLSERAFVWDCSLVVDDTPRSSLGEPWTFGLALGAGRQPELEVVTR